MKTCLWSSALGGALLGGIFSYLLFDPWAAMLTGLASALLGLMLGGAFQRALTLRGLAVEATRRKLVPPDFPWPQGPWLLDNAAAHAKALDIVLGQNESRRNEGERLQDVVRKYAGNPASLEVQRKKSPELAGMLRPMTILFVDLRGYTGLSEKVKPQDMVLLLNDYYAEMEALILKYKGHINKYIGDAVLAMFYATSDFETGTLSDVERACCAGLDMIQQFDMILSRWRAKYGGDYQVGVGVGIATGPVLVGNIGTASRMEFGVIGDAVNMASRLCGLAPDRHVLLDQKAFHKAQYSITALPKGETKIKGKAEPQAVYELSAIKPEARARKI